MRGRQRWSDDADRTTYIQWLIFFFAVVDEWHCEERCVFNIYKYFVRAALCGYFNNIMTILFALKSHISIHER